MRATWLLGLWLAGAAPAAGAGLLSAQGVAVLDTALTPRPAFTDTERVVFQQRVFNSVASAGRIAYRFVVLSPSGGQVFEHVGNSVPGSVGSSASQLTGVPISDFHAGPGVYTLRATAELDGQIVEQSAQFTVSSPNILLIYPPNGAQGVADVPLILRWTSSGASKYRVTVGDNPSFYNAVFSQETVGSEDFMTYPDNPPDPRQRLAAGQVYYWKVEGYDVSGLKVAESPAPFSFTVAAAALTKDLAVTDLVVGAPAPDGSYPFTVTVANQGGTTEVGVPLKFSVGGLPAPGTPVTLDLIAPTESRTYNFSSLLPVDQQESLAIACVEFSDNNIANNCKTLMVTRPKSSSDQIFGGASQLTPEQIWSAIQELLKAQGYDLSDYSLVSLEGSLTQQELLALLEALKSGQASVTVTGPVVAPGSSVAVPVVTPIAGSTAAVAALPAAPQLPEASGEENEWTGYAAPLFGQNQAFLIKTEQAFKRVWSRLSDAEQPEVDFKRHIVVAIVAGRNARVDRVEIDAIRRRSDHEVVRYRLIQDRSQRRGGGLVPYLLRAVPKAKQAVEFEKIED